MDDIFEQLGLEYQDTEDIEVDIEADIDLGDEFITAYEDDYAPDFDEEGDDEDDDFIDYQSEEEDYEKYQASYSQMEHIGFGDPMLGTTIGGKFSKLEKIVQMQTIPKEHLFINKLKAELDDYFSPDLVNYYATLVESVPRFWLKNSTAIAKTVAMIHQLKNTELTVAKLSKHAAEKNIRPEDLLRYYRLLNKYINK